MDLAAEAALEESHDQLMLLDAGHPLEAVAHDARGEMDVVGALDLGLRTGDRRLDRALQFG